MIDEIMLNEIKAEIIQLTANRVFTRNLALVSLVAIAGLYSLADLQSRNLSATELGLRITVSYSTSGNISSNAR